MMTQDSQAVKNLVKLVQFPLTRIVLGFILIAVAVSLTEAARDAWTKNRNILADFFLILVGTLVISMVYAAFVRLVERRPVIELSRPGAFRELAAGILVSTSLFTITVVILWTLGFYQVSGFNDWTVIVPALGVAIYHGVYEELLFRGIVFRIIEESLGSWLAVAISALVFGLFHLANPNPTLWGVSAIAIEAGITLAAAYIFSRRLWLIIGMHFAWNFIQGGVFGVAVSGTNVTGLVKATLAGPAWLSGGEFGAEASVIVVAFSLVIGVYFLWKAWKKGYIIQPFWKKTSSSKSLRAHPDSSRARPGFDLHL